MQRHGQIAPGEKRELVPLVKEGCRPPQVAFPCFGQGIEHRGACIIVILRGRGDLIEVPNQESDRLLHGHVIHDIASLASLREAENHIGAECRRTLCVAPPAPTTVQVLEGIDPLQARRNLLCERHL